MRMGGDVDGAQHQLAVLDPRVLEADRIADAAPSPTENRSGARSLTEPMTTSLPMRAPSARHHQACSEAPLMK